MVRLFAMLVTKDDADVIEEVVEHAAVFCDRILCLDNCSADGTWERLGELESRHEGVVVRVRQFDERFYDGIRAELYEAGRADLGDGWWMFLAPDEFMTTDPRPLLAEAHAAGADAVMAWMAQFVFTDRDLREWEAGRDDTSRPIRERRRSYRVDWREFRFFRNEPDRPWADRTLYLPRPEASYRVHRRLAVLAHYQFRTPDQIRHRLELRHGLFPHVTTTDWRTEVRPAWKYQRWRGGPIRTTGAWYYARRLRQRAQQVLGRRDADRGIQPE